ncbi:hypothetical protein RAD16_32505 [Bradyrhizobium sp. 18BD]
MNELFLNAVKSLQLGLEDYQANDPKRSLSAVRNFYAGTLLMAKAALVKQLPEADPALVLAASYKPKPDGKGGLVLVPSERTIDFNEIGQRFKSFGLAIDNTALRNLNRIRNEAEHNYTSASHQSVREAISQAFPVVVDLFDLLGERPHKHLAECWNTMLEAKNLYDKEFAQCQGSFGDVPWTSASMAAAVKTCPSCRSHLVQLAEDSSTEPTDLEARCRQCGAEIAAGRLFEASLNDYFGADLYAAAADGDAPPLGVCRACGFGTYVMAGDENACAFCEDGLSKCEMCSEPLTPFNVSPDSDRMCDYCARVLSKD